MTVHTFEHTQTIPALRERVFAFFQVPENLAHITPPSMGFRILTPSPIEMRTGALIDYTVRIFGIPVRWRTLITTYDPPRMFVDEQLKGPYSFWHHTHAFIEQEECTLMVDTVRYALPFGPLGKIAHAMVVRRQIERIFAYRAEFIMNYFTDQSGEAPHTLPKGEPARSVVGAAK